MALKVSCPNCLSLLQVPRKLRGKVVVCPCCKEKCRVPLPSTVGASPTAAVVQPGVAADAQVRPYDPSRGSWIRTAVVASIAAAVVAVGGLILSAAMDFNRRHATPEAGQDPPPGVEQPGLGETTGDGGPTAVAAANPQLASQAEQVLRTHCYRCHGEDGVAEGGFNFVLRRDRLVAGGSYVDPGDPDKSKLLTRIKGDEMPPAGEKRPTKEEVAILQSWIAAGAPDFSTPLNRPFLSNADLVKFIRQDLNEVPSRDHRHTRYFTLVSLFNAGYSDDEMETYRLALSKLVNSLSWHKEVVQPKPVDPHGTVFRIDLRTLGWDDEEGKIWQAIIDANPYSVRMNDDDSDSRFCTAATQCELPHVRGDWFVAAASRPPLYHTVLQVPETLKDLLAKRFAGKDLDKEIKQESVVRAGFGRSGVSTHNRLLEWHHSPYGYFWISYDFGGDNGRKDLARHPLGPGTKEDDFEHDGGEIIFSLPNGLQGYMLTDAAGKRLEKGPISIVSDTRRPDRLVTNGVSCMSCHYGGIIPKADEIRSIVEGNRQGFKGKYEQIMALYPPKNELDRLYAENAAQFREAVHKVGIKELTETGEPIVNMALRFEADVDTRSAAAELGLTLTDFQQRLKSNPRVLGKLGALNIEGGTVKRLLFAQEFTSVVEELGLGEAFNKPTDKPVAAATTPPAAPEPKATSPSLRTWSDVKSNIKLEAEFVNLDGDKVELRKADGTATQVPLANLSPEDRTFVAAQLAQAPNTSLPPGEKVADNNPPVIPPGAGKRPGGSGPGGNPPLPGVGGPGGKNPLPENAVPREMPARTWHNLAIDKTVDARFISLVKGDIKLADARFKGIAAIVWPMHDMSPEDHEYVRQQVGEEAYLRHKDPPY